jgi:heparin/heparan-sulfate lyase
MKIEGFFVCILLIAAVLPTAGTFDIRSGEKICSTLSNIGFNRSLGNIVVNETVFSAEIREDHPRLFFNADTWPAVKERALTVNREHLERVREYAESDPPDPYWDDLILPPPRPGTNTLTRDWGYILPSAAFVYLIDHDPQQLKKIKEMLWASLDYYHASYAQNKAVSWTSFSRIGWLCAIDWVWNNLSADERYELGQSFMKHVYEIFTKPYVERRNLRGYTWGYYGADNVAVFTGVVFLNEGINDEIASQALEIGYNAFINMLNFRNTTTGDDGGFGSPTLGYTLGRYPIAEWNFFYVYQSVTGEDISSYWPYISLLPNYILWNLLPGNLEFGYGDCYHVTNKITYIAQLLLFTHLSNIMHFYGQSYPERAALAAYLRDRIGGSYFLGSFISIYPFLMFNLEKAPPPEAPKSLLPARCFENMGQVFMRSGTGENDTFALFACGGMVEAHRQYDATHFTIYHKGFLALDSGTRLNNTDSLQNYYAQTVAHNCVLIKMPGEPPSPYWNGPVYGQAGGQYKILGSKLIAFETHPLFTYVAGDATEVYRPEKCELMVRQLIFIPPFHFIVFDRVTSTNAMYGKRWLLHHANEPTMLGDMWYSDQDRGRIFCRTLLPRGAVIEKIGGPGKEFVADGVNYPISEDPDFEVPELMGRWRVEVSPSTPNKEDIFLHFIQVGGQSLQNMNDVEMEENNEMVKLSFKTEDLEVSLELAKTGAVGGHITIKQDGEIVIDKNLAQAISDYYPVRIIKPKERYLYFADREITPLQNTVVIGKITVEVDALDVDGIDKVEFYVNDVLKSIDKEPPYQWLWDEFAVGWHRLKVVAYDESGDSDSDEIKVIIFNL